MLGERIRQARLECGLSQQQLAGTELTRSFICRMEHGKVNPSRKTLLLLAHRLGKPPEYFTASDLRAAEATRLLAESERAFAAWDLEPALAAAGRAVTAAEGLGQPALEYRARLQWIKIHEKLGRHREALALGEDLLVRFPAPPPLLLAEAWYYIGLCRYALEDLDAARRSLERAGQLAAARPGLGALTEHHTLSVRVNIALGACLGALGRMGEAAAALRAALAACPPDGAADCQGVARMNLGWILYKQGDLVGALALTRDARSTLEALGHPCAVYARHNLGVMEAEQNHWDQAIELLQSCLETYAERGLVRLQAAALEELGRCFLVHRYLQEALEVCGQALALLDQEDDSVQRGRLYRLMAAAHQAGGDLQRAHDLALVGLELFRRLGASEELDATRAFLTGLTVTTP